MSTEIITGHYRLIKDMHIMDLTPILLCMANVEGILLSPQSELETVPLDSSLKFIRATHRFDKRITCSVGVQSANPRSAYQTSKICHITFSSFDLTMML